MIARPRVGVVVDLVDPYFTAEVKNAGGFKATSPGSNTAIWWLRRNPGRWALVGEGTTGLTKQLLKQCPDLYGTERSFQGVIQVYACLPHPEGESLKAALERRPLPRGLYLPEVTKDEFNWSPEELKEACRVARENLFPVSP
jgi:hypothetical protein